MEAPIGRLLDLYEQTTPAIRRRGRAWYPECGRLLRAIADANGCKLSHAVAVFAIVSPAVQLATALDWTDAILRGKRAGGRYPNVQGARIERALAYHYPSYAMTGPKVSAFYRAIMGDTDALVLDRWAFRAAGQEYGHSPHYIPVSVQRAVDAMYREAAAACSETVRAFQAMLWILVRESTPKRTGTVPRLADITT